MNKEMTSKSRDLFYLAPERRYNILEPAFCFNVYSIVLIALIAALSSLTDAYAMDAFVSNVLWKGRFFFSLTCEAIAFGRIAVSQAASFDLIALAGISNEEMYSIFAKTSTERLEDRSDVKDGLRSRFFEMTEGYL